VIKRWAKKVLEGLLFLHQKNIVHGKLTCESIYINSNNGEIKIGDIGIKHIYAISEQQFSLANSNCSELGQSRWYLKE
jgi:serine/threonine protein kinase